MLLELGFRCVDLAEFKLTIIKGTGSTVGTNSMLEGTGEMFRAKNKTVHKDIRGSEAGLTLVELLVVLAILSLFAALAAPQVLRYLGSARSETAQAQISSLVSAVELYYLDVGEYPSQDVGLKALSEAPTQATGWNGPYLKKSSGILDPWGKPYIYKRPGKQGAFEILTLGRDGQAGGEGEDKDVTSWE